MRRNEWKPAGVTRAGWWLGVALVSGVAALAAETAATENQETFSVFNGKQSYKSFCMNCHGVEAKGDGYLAPNLSARPTNLTTLAKKNGGVYPADRVSSSIDGRVAVKEHGRREMPVWGDAFLWPEQESPERRESVRRKIGELVEYLRSVQDPPPAATPAP
jgi:mono/diheme cytochrome c family protein